MEKQELAEMEKSIGEKVGVDSDFIIIYPMRITNPVYSDPDKYLRSQETPILIKLKSGEIIPFDEISPITGAPQKYVEKFFAFCPEGKQQVVNDAVDEIIEQL